MLNNIIAVLIPVYNNLSGLIKSIESIEEYESLEVVIVDDGSLEKIDLAILTSISKNQVKLLTMAENGGIVKALNCGLEYIYKNNFNYVVRLDAGDLCVNNRVEKQVRFLEDNQDYVIVGSYAEFVDLNGQKIFTQVMPSESEKINKYMHLNNCFCHPAVTFRINSLTKDFYYEEAYKFAEDYKFFWDMIKKGKGANLPQVLVITEANPTGISRTRRKEQLKLRLSIQLDNFKFNILNSYIGMLKTIILMLLPNLFIENFKKLISK
ncbi:glycosyltransferase [Pseudoalteromonas tunicata]|uniref:glycosyltransferase n=1 Tax=Pseudoalteromonas tunicata TaxID=314281 RepID=UPI00273DD60A|nr:glycosyltransferase [Pseudoalteromonas tunicata]MDP5211621.1 glycosyltransferase [Pseudoalteromonas tunicata]